MALVSFFRIFTPLLVIFTLIAFSAETHAQHDQTPEADLLFTGITLYENGQFDEAIRVLEAFKENEGNERQRRKSMYYIALSRAAAEPDRTILHFDTFIAEYPESREAAQLYVDLAHRYSYEGDLEQAVALYEKALSLQLPADLAPQVLFWTAETYVSKRNYEQAHHFFSRIPDEHATSRFAPKALYTQGRLHLMNNEYDEASEKFERLRANYPVAEVTGRVGTALGEAYYRQGRFPEAIESLRRAMSGLNDEQQAKATLIVAESYNYLNELDDAANWYRRYIRLVEGTQEERLAHYGLGWVFHKQGVYHWAADSFGRAVTSDDDVSRRALYYKAVNQKLAGRYDLALNTFEQFSRTFTSGPWVEQAYYEWAITLFEIGDHVSAIETLLYVVRNLEPLENPGDIYTLLGEAYFANAEYTRAIESFQRAEASGQVTPEVQLKARFQRAWVLYRNRAYDEAQPIFESIYVQSPTSDIGGEALFWSADSYFNMREFGPASARFQRYLAEFRGGEFTSAARYSLGWSYFMMGEFERAIPPFRQFLDNFEEPEVAIFPYDIDAKLRIADANFALRNYDEAITFYETAQAFERSADYATFQIANSFYRSDQTFESVRTFRQLINDFPQSSFREQAQYSIGYIYLLSGNYSQAIQEFERTIERFPRSQWAARAQYNIGNAHFNAGDFSAAISAYQRVLDRYPQSNLIIEAVNGIQFAQEAAGQSDTSTQKLEDFIAANPQAGTADQLRFRQAQSLLETSDYEGAIQSFRQYIRVTNNERMIPEAWFNIAEAHRRAGDRSQAREAYRTVIDDFPNSDRRESALLELGNMHLSAGEYDNAMARFTQLSESSRRLRFDARIGMANAALGKGDVSEAERNFNLASSLGGDQDQVRLGLGKVAFQRSNFSEARDLFRQVSENSSGATGAEAQYRLGLSLQRMNSHIDAIRELGNVRIFFGAYTNWVAEAMLASIDSNLALGNRTEAEQISRMIREEYPGTGYAQRAQSKLR
ncbi:MAG: tetratricopeptide repeat protein [Balneolia bacterium]|nr:tetratricopeptide repeat protein [Balneolia bacterium]